VVARVLLEGGEVDEKKLEKEIEEQKVKDEQEGRKRGVSKSRPPGRRSRSHSQIYEDYLDHDLANQLGYADYNQPIYANTRSKRIGGHRKEMYDLEPLPFGHHDEHMYQQQQQFYEHPFQQQQVFESYPYETEMPPPLFPASRSRRGAPASLSLDQYQTQGMIGEGHMPATPRTLAIQQYHEQLNDKMRNGIPPGFMSPNAAAFSLRSPTTAAMMISPLKDTFGGRRERGVSFDPSMLDNMRLDHRQVLDPSLDDRSRAHSQPWLPNEGEMSAFHVAPDSNNYFEGQGPPGMAFDTSQLNSMLQNNGSVQPFSAFGELAAQSAVQPGDDRRNEISFIPEGDTQYIYLRRDQAQDRALVESIRQACVLLLLTRHSF
jgi:hypothetical protein